MDSKTDMLNFESMLFDLKRNKVIDLLHRIIVHKTATLKVGNSTDMTCYKKGCEEVKIPVTLGREFPVHPSFNTTLTSGGRVHWRHESILRGFELSEIYGGSGYCQCPRCKTLFGGVIVVSDGQIFGYDPEPA